MTNREFYDKWGKTEELKVVVNAIVFRGLQMYGSWSTESRDGEQWYNLTSVLSGEPVMIEDDYIKYIECYRDLTRMSDGFIKNVIKKVL